MHPHTAIEVPGTATLNKGRNALVESVSCPSAGNCGAGGNYTDSNGHLQAFVVTQGWPVRVAAAAGCP